MILESEWLVFDTRQNEDQAALRPIATDPEVMRYITGGIPWSGEQMEHFIYLQTKLHSERGFCRWKLTEKSTNHMIGFCGVGFCLAQRRGTRAAVSHHFYCEAGEGRVYPDHAKTRHAP